MSFETLGDLNWLAVLVATVAYFALGGLWYAAPVFGRAWQRAGGIEIPEGQSPGAKYYVGPLLTCFVSSIATAMLAFATASATVAEGLVLGIVVGVGFALPLSILGGMFDQKPEPGVYVAISAGYHLVGLMIVGVIVSVWT
jgi:hypothetical protein